MRASAALFALLSASAHAFAPVQQPHRVASTELAAERREVFGMAAAAALSTFGLSMPAQAASNPALETLKAKKGSKNQYIPGKGLHQHDDMLVAANNPALQTLKAKKGSKNQYIPGKGLHQHDDFLMAANNPALQTLKAKKGSKNQYIPGKGLHKDFDLFA